MLALVRHQSSTRGTTAVSERSVHCAVSRVSDEQRESRRVVAHVRGVFDNLERLLVDDGTAWLSVADVETAARRGSGSSIAGLPWRIALALQRDGWILRNAIIWSSQGGTSLRHSSLNASYETMLLFAKQRRYYFDLDAVRVAPRTGSGQPRNPGDVWFSSATTSPRPELPLDIATRCITAGCPQSGVVLDPLNGAASIEFAALRSGRLFAGASLDRAEERPRWAA